MISKIRAKRNANPFLLTIVFLFFGIIAVIVGLIGKSADYESINEAFNIGLLKNNSYEGEVKYSSQCVCELNHKINYIIPMGTEYFYIAFSEDQSKAIVIRADKDFGDNFDEDSGKALSAINVKGKASKMDLGVTNHLLDIKSELPSDMTHGSFELFYLNTFSSRYYNLLLFSGIGFFISDILITLCYLKIKLKNPELEYSQYSLMFSKSDKIQILIGALILIVSLFACAYAFFIR